MTQADVQVEQVDREAAADLIESYYGAGHWSEEHEAMKKLAASLRAGHGGLWPAAFARHRQQSILAYEAERAALVEAAHEKGFETGYLIAVANIMNLHDEDVIAEDVLRQLGAKESCLDKHGLTDYDLKPLRKLFRKIARQAAITRSAREAV